MDVEIERIYEPKGWDDNVKEFGGSVFSMSSWVTALSKPDYIPAFFYFKLNGSISGTIAGIQVPLSNHSYEQLLFYAGVASNQLEIEFYDACKRKLLQYCKVHNLYRIVIKSYDYRKLIPSALNTFHNFNRVEYVINLGREQKEIFNSFSRLPKRMIRRAKNNKVDFLYGHSQELFDLMEDLLESTKLTRIKKGYGNYNPIGWPYLKKDVIMNLLKNQHIKIYALKHNKEIINMQLLYYQGEGAYGILAATSPQGYKMGSYSYLIWMIIKDLMNNSVKYYNLGSIPIGEQNDGIRKYKESIGAKPIESFERSTFFINRPLSNLNFLMHLKNILKAGKLPDFIKYRLIAFIDFFLRGRDIY